MNKNKLSILLATACIFISMSSYSQNDTAKFGIKFNGFVNSQLMYDTRQTLGGRETMLVLYPENKKLDKYGKDVNASPSFNQLATLSRISSVIL